MTAVIVLVLMLFWTIAVLTIAWVQGYEYGKQGQVTRIENLCDALTVYAAECYELRSALLTKEVDEAFRDAS